MRVRRAVQVDGMSERQAAREFGLARKTVRKMLAYAMPIAAMRVSTKEKMMSPGDTSRIDSWNGLRALFALRLGDQR
jgi:DNA-binding transcriptional regulator LsrR (DeoR family)